MNLKKDVLIFLNSVIEGIEKIKGREIVILEMSKDRQAICDYLVICSATSSTQALAISREIEKVVSRDLKEKPSFVEGLKNASWILMDYIDVIVHIFEEEARNFYHLEEFYLDAKKIDFINLKNAKDKQLKA